MKLVRYGAPGRERPGLVDEQGELRDLSAHVADIDAAALSPSGLDNLRRIDPRGLPVVEAGARIAIPVSGIGNVLGIGLNYRSHAAEAGMPVPDEPIVFSKHTSALSGPYDPIRLPPGSAKTDWEVELAVIIGRTTRHVTESEALECVAGFAVCNDVSERSYQLDRGGQWIKGKSYDGFFPLGPWLITADEVPDPQALHLWLDVNGERMQDGTTADMIFSVAEIVSYLSRFMTLLPGDVIATGTPPGVGLGRGVFLKDGDVVRLGIDGLGEQREVVVEG
ncbi:MAG: fumarylacetoacetate hydrolase family protein [Rhodospirillales bacterium]|nr:fumarylacetoacetate hydrolase family protein [Rhodospirillales bacterium]